MIRLKGIAAWRKWAPVALVAALTWTPNEASADLNDLKGLTVRLIIAAAAGDTSDTEARMLFKAIEPLVPETTLRIQNDATNAGATALLEVANASGRVVTLAAGSHSFMFRPLLTPASTPYDLTRMQWIGSLTKVNRLLAVRKELPVSVAALSSLGRQLIAGAGGASGASALEPLLVNALTPLAMRVITGMGEGERQSLILAGRVDVRTGSFYELQPLFESGEMKPVLRFSTGPVDPRVDSVPSIAEVARSDAPAALVAMIETIYQIGGNMIAAAPSTEPKVVAALREVFDVATRQRSFIEAAARSNIIVSPTTGAKLDESIKRLFGPGSTMGATMQAAIACGTQRSEAATAACR